MGTLLGTIGIKVVTLHKKKKSMKARFLLKGNKVSVYVTIDGKKNKYATGIECDPTKWSKGYPMRNQTLVIEQIQKIENPLNEYLAKNDYTSHTVKQMIDELLGKSTLAEKNLIKNQITQYLASKKDVISTNHFNKIVAHLKDFEQVVKNRIVKDLDKAFFNLYHLHLAKKNLNANTLNSYVKNVQTFINWLYENELMDRKVTLERFKGKEKDIIAINDSELNILLNCQLPSERLERIKDLFLFSCFTGLRYSDTQAVNAKLITDEVLTIRQQKTENIVQIPLIHEAQQILEKYNYQLPTISNQKANKYLKELFTTLNLNRAVYVGTELVDLNKVISFHVSRKSFITIALSNGIHAKVVQSISGHKKDEVFNKYIAFSDSTLKQEMGKMSLSARVMKKVI